MVLDRDAAQIAAAQLRLQCTHLLRQKQIRTHLLEQRRVHRRHVHRPLGGPVHQDLQNILRDLACHAVLRLHGRGPQMRRADHLAPTKERMVPGRGFLLVHVERGSDHPARFNRVQKRRLVDQSSPRAVENAHAGFACRQRRRGNQMPRGFVQRRMQRDIVRGLVYFLERRQPYPESRRHLFGE